MTRGRPALCPYCRSTAIISKGYRKTVTMGLRKVRLCKSCARRFTKGKKKVIDSKPHLDAPEVNTADVTVQEQGGGEVVSTAESIETIDDLTRLAVVGGNAEQKAPLGQ